jgi:methanol dehydrogenase (cytochrome c) subunit 2
MFASGGARAKKAGIPPELRSERSQEEIKVMKKLLIVGTAAAAALIAASSAFAYDGTKCKAPGNCWEPKPGFPEKVAGSKYDPMHDPAELAKQGDSERAMEARNAKRTANFIKTGTWVYDVDEIPN